MRYYILTTTKFANECIAFEKYGAGNANWLANIDIGDIVFISQFNYKSQDLYGPFRVTSNSFFDRTRIFPKGKFYYRIDLKPIDSVRILEEIDIYFYGIEKQKIELASRFINLIQQNKHLHSICLNRIEGEFLSRIFTKFGKPVKIKRKQYASVGKGLKVDLEYLSAKNKISTKSSFLSENYLESFILLSLKEKDNCIRRQLSTTLNNFPENKLENSDVYNQFIFGNAYPSDIVIVNKANANIFELKKDILSRDLMPQIRKEMYKYCYFSLFSPRLDNQEVKRMNFFLLALRGGDPKLKAKLREEFNKINQALRHYRENSFTILEYYIEENRLVIGEAK
ncbi:MAG: hypothetical protein A3B99_05255 [Candidatus Yanofskybacteria bacterium RIFCSPHIGHO2_02_FULL_44_12b]|uniref:Uncharacterized protein n=1 Tax=Candidatus Yanofskybacteria bacterium RIFCSPLOWO2_01_FULL_44_22 TaxID=1802697 RepID=A0A1F8GL27_9BACT|nr:MAG: hypothetical protein A3B99_05255 [Candidatus Yanofskybacteria bacterium RIFCSPHIGHO2_02_FULL_44_12b]OGN26104.1 MAG: hypothetical protein A2925_00580 [Candidatus Yanofskybacteria bacterium RIFCSPLOWO2_01_FULL_44_22]